MQNITFLCKQDVFLYLIWNVNKKHTALSILVFVLHELNPVSEK